MKTIINLLILIPLFFTSLCFAQLADVDGTIRSNAATPTMELYDDVDERVEGSWEEFDHEIFLYSTYGDLKLGAVDDGISGRLNTYMTLKSDNKRVGINTTDPTSAFQVNVEGSERSIGLSGITQFWKDSATILASMSHVFDGILIQNQKVATTTKSSTFSLQTTKKDGTSPIQFMIDGDGEIGLGSFATDPQSSIHLKHREFTGAGAEDDGIRFENEGPNENHFSFFVTNGNGFLHIFSKAAAGVRIAEINDVSGAYVALSDARFKNNIKPLRPVLDKVTRLNPVTYSYNHQVSKEDRFSGFLAQELNVEFPEYVSYDKESDVYGVDYAGLSTIAIKAVQEQQLHIDRQQQQINTQQQQLDLQHRQIENLRSELDEIKIGLANQLKHVK